MQDYVNFNLYCITGDILLHKDLYIFKQIWPNHFIYEIGLMNFLIVSIEVWYYLLHIFVSSYLHFG